MDARLTGDQEVAGSTPTGSATFFSWRLIMIQKPTDLDLHCLIKQGISGFSRLVKIGIVPLQDGYR